MDSIPGASALPAGRTRIKAVRLQRSRWPVELGYQQMEEGLGLHHFEGRSWRGFIAAPAW